MIAHCISSCRTGLIADREGCVAGGRGRGFTSLVKRRADCYPCCSEVLCCPLRTLHCCCAEEVKGQTLPLLMSLCVRAGVFGSAQAYVTALMRKIHLNNI
jgi:hypothetical protein